MAQLGVLLYIFTVGLELHPDLMRHRAHATVAISHTSILVPFMLGALLALELYPRLLSSNVLFTSFALFLGVAMSVAAFPVLARILTDRRMLRTKLGAIALSCVATDDVTAWCLLALVVGVAPAQLGAGLVVAAGTLAYITLIFLLVRPLLRCVVARWDTEPLPRNAGAFLLGAIIPHDSPVALTCTRQLEAVVTVL